RSAAFYDAALEPLGGVRVMDFGAVVGFGTEGRPSFWLGPLVDQGSNRPIHLAFVAPDRDAVHGFFDAAVGQGAVALHQPREWPEHGENYYAAFVRDPNGHNIEAVCHLAT